MTIRVVLVALVAVLGLDLGDVVSNARAGRDWIAARLPETPSMGFESESAAVETAAQDVASGPAADVVFGRADLVFEAAVESMAATFTADFASAHHEPAPAFTEVEVDQDSKIEKLTEAVRLTRRAVDAWSGLIQAVADPVAPEDRGDSL